MIYRGDQYYLQFTITDEEKKSVSSEKINSIEKKVKDLEYNI